MSCSLHTRSARGCRFTAFTLVELLVVIGIIAVLISILLPALNRARESGNLVKCQANLKQIGLAMMMYTNANKGMMPYGFLDGSSGHRYAGSDTSDWTTLLVNALSGKKEISYASGDNSAGINQRGPRQLFVCPSAQIDPSPPSPGSLPPILTHYAAHPRLLPNVDGKDYFFTSKQPFLDTVRIGHIKRSAEIAVIFDASLQQNLGFIATACCFGLDNAAIEGPPSLVEDYTRVNGGSTANASDPVSMNPYVGGRSPSPVSFNSDDKNNLGNVRFRHTRNSAANVLMLDGHVQTFKYNPVTHVTDLQRRNVYVNK